MLSRNLEQTLHRALSLASERRSEPPDPAFWAAAEPIGRVVRARGGVEAEAYRVYRVTPRPGAPIKLLPHPGDG